MTLDKTDFQTRSNSGTGSHDKTGIGGGGFPSGEFGPLIEGLAVKRHPFKVC